LVHESKEMSNSVIRKVKLNTNWIKIKR
jgi:hypothetical protein